MKPAPKWMPSVIALGLMAAVLVFWHATTPAAPPEPPGPSTQAYVRMQLSVVRGVQMVLPVDLPAGYDYPTAYHYATAQIADDQTTVSGHDRADSRSVVFYPARNRAQADLPVVVMCVQLTDLKDELCPSIADSRHLQRHYQHTRVAIYATGNAHWDVDTWKNVQLTADLNQVRWLH
ncbi:hypothetical protein [Actinopolymorpha rutila]|uniref:Uncharacterized protein n=1 Tax=Actinopolymorpha rutila TaxID=446787 RepID=A0A852ZTY2_9ACTN|nr:hypothetical protein [Actinopolymorpha rutila]NYH92809.1 hypothetical protein [Actinopolymorpha rutila]